MIIEIQNAFIGFIMFKHECFGELLAIGLTQFDLAFVQICDALNETKEHLMILFGPDVTLQFQDPLHFRLLQYFIELLRNHKLDQIDLTFGQESEKIYATICVLVLWCARRHLPRLLLRHRISARYRRNRL